jgi:CO dehydrogenase maturation factor
MKIAVCGKGGVGKTTISGTLSRLLGKKGAKILAIDGDPNPNLSIVLGIDREKPAPPPLQSDILERGEKADGTRFIKLGVPLSEVIKKYGIEAPDNVQLLTVGQPEHAGTGCMCGSHTTVREIIHAAMADAEQMTILDMEASLEHMKRGTSKYVDTMFAVVEPYYRSLEAAGRFKKFADELGIKKVAAIANKVRNDEEEQAIRQYCEKIDLPIEIIIPFDSQISEADLAGKAILDYNGESEAVKELQKLADSISLN